MTAVVSGVSNSDAELIRVLVEQYGIGFDTSDRELVLACFSDDAHLSYLNGNKVVDGIAAIRREMFHFDDSEWKPLPGFGRILFSDHRFRIDWLSGTADGAVEGRVSAVAHLLTERDGETSLVIRGIRYSDRYTRTTAGWRIAERRHEQLWESAGPARRFPVDTAR